MRVEVIDRRAERDGGGDRRRAGFELGRQLGGREAVEPNAVDHAAAAEERRHGVEQFFAAVEHADAGGAEHLVAAEGEEVGAQLADVRRQVRHALGRVDQHQRAGRVRPAGDFAIGLIVPSTFETEATATILVRSVSSVSSASRIEQAVVGDRDVLAGRRRCARRAAARARGSSGAPSW